MSKPVVAIVGRPNVGKSALFNRITGKQISLVYDRPGVTRDRITHECAWDGKAFTLIDTGGIGLEDESGFEEAIQREVGISLGVATEVLLVVDGREGVMPLDREIAQRLRRAGGPQGPRVLVAVNKMDSEVQRGWEAEFVALGWPVVAVSAAHGRGMDVLMGRLTRDFPDVETLAAEAARPTNVAIVGRPNSGKSSLINALLAEERVIVSPIAGTTRDAVDISFERNGKSYLLVDTAGMRRRARVHDPLEQAMASRSAHSINRAEVCLLVLDAVLGISDQEKKIAGLIQQARKPCLVVVNKWDLAAEAEQALSGQVLKEEPAQRGGGRQQKPPGTARPADWKAEFQRDYEAAVRRSLFFLTYAPVVFSSAKEREGMEGVCRMLEEVGDARRAVLPGGPLNRLMRGALERHAPVAVKGRTLKIYYVAQQREGADVPTLTAFINRKALWTEHYQRYLEQKVREAHPLPGCPLVWKLKDKEVRGEGAAPSGRAGTPGHRAGRHRPAQGGETRRGGREGEGTAPGGGFAANPPAREVGGTAEELRPHKPARQGAGRKTEFSRRHGDARRGKAGAKGRGGSRGMGRRSGGKTTGGRYRAGKGRTRARGRAGKR